MKLFVLVPKFITIGCFFLLFTVFNSCRQNGKPEPDIFKFSEKYLLNWTDFRGMPDTNRKYAAVTNSGMEYYYLDKSKNDRLVISFNVRSFFDRSKSWYREGDLPDDALEHEQFHYLISELNTRLMRKHLQEFQFTDNYENEIQQIFNFYLKSLSEMQDKYDLETKNSWDRTHQRLWEKNVLLELTKLNDYSDELFDVKTDLTISYYELQTRKLMRSKVNLKE